MQDWIAPFLTTEGLIALLTLTVLEIVLGIDNVVFIAVICGKLPPGQRLKASRTGIGLAVITRVLLLLTITWLIGLDKHKLFTIPLPQTMLHQPEDATLPRVTGHAFSAKDLVLLLGGLFLLFKSATEIHGKVAGGHIPGDPGSAKSIKAATIGSVIVQIILIDIVFSFDSVITAAGMSGQIPVMVSAVLISAAVMMIFAGPVMNFVNKHPSIKVLALSFLVLIGTMLIAESCGQHIPKGYIYFAMAFSLGVEVLNMKVRSKAHAPARPEREPLM